MSEPRTTISISRDIHEELKVKAARRRELITDAADAALRIGVPKLSDKPRPSTKSK